LFVKFFFATLIYALGTTSNMHDIHSLSESNEIQQENIGNSKNSKYDPSSVDDLMSKNITNFLKYSFLKNELDQLTEFDRRFQMYLIDLNGDGKDEYFVRFMSPYFCGTGGCTFLLLDRYAEIITQFSVMDAPLYITKIKSKGWHNIYLYNNGSYRELKYNGKKYPSNPSTAAKIKFNKKEIVKTIFDDSNSPAKTYSY